MEHSSNRNYGIDIARLVAMIMVVTLHNLGKGGVLDWKLDSTSDLIYMLIENYAIVAVNVFALITGYLTYGKPLRTTNLLKLWLTAIFWSTATSIVGFLLGQQSLSEVIFSIFPVSTGEYWYFNSYLLLQFFIPIINTYILNSSDRELGLLATVLLIAASLFQSTGISDGYSAIWLIILWITGAAIKKNETLILKNVRTEKLLLLYLIIPLIVLYFECHDARQGQISPIRWISYNNPYVTVSSICFFIVLTRIKVSSSSLQNLLRKASPLAFSVYLIDTSNWFYSYWLSARFEWISEMPLICGLPILLLISVIMFGTFLLLERIRFKTMYIFTCRMHNQSK